MSSLQLTIFIPPPVLLTVVVVSIFVEILNNSGKHYAGGGRLELLRNSFFRGNGITLPPIDLDKTYRHHFVAPVLGCRTYSDIPTTLVFQLDGKRHTFSSSPIRYATELRLLMPTPSTPLGSPSRFNILLFGLAGAAKSSFVCSAMTLFSDDGRIYRGVPAGGGQRHNTVSLQKYLLPGSNVSLLDVWGVTRDNYDSSIVLSILSGILPSGWRMGAQLEAHQQVFQQHAGTRFQRRAHAILFVYPHTAFSDPALASLRAVMREHFGLVSREGHNPLLIITMCDELDPSFRADPSSPSTALQGLRRTAAAEVGIPVNRVHLCINYVSEDRPTSRIAKNTLEILAAAIHTADDYCTVKATTGVDESGLSWD